jgi:peptidoglycan/xylan/chitin deacetylase (PgdA/CDA1 family)
MRVHLTFDVEVWCAGWDRLDESFPAAFERYVWGHSSAGAYALPKNLEILQRHGLVGVFFVEPLFSLRFGAEHLRTITTMILAAGQDVQLHLHPEWVDEIRPALLPEVHHKRQHLTAYSEAEQTTLLQRGKRLVESATGRPVTAFRSGGYAVNRDSYRALAASGLQVDSSLNATFDHSAGSLGGPDQLRLRQAIDGVQVHPVTVFRDGLGRDRHCQVGACSAQELREVLDRAHDQGHDEVVLVSHNFELLKPGSTAPDHVVERRFEAVCAHLAAHPQRFQVGSFPLGGAGPAAPAVPAVPLQTGLWATGVRHLEQARRRLV